MPAGGSGRTDSGPADGCGNPGRGHGCSAFRRPGATIVAGPGAVSATALPVSRRGHGAPGPDSARARSPGVAGLVMHPNHCHPRSRAGGAGRSGLSGGCDDGAARIRAGRSGKDQNLSSSGVIVVVRSSTPMALWPARCPAHSPGLKSVWLPRRSSR